MPPTLTNVFFSSRFTHFSFLLLIFLINQHGFVYTSEIFLPKHTFQSLFFHKIIFRGRIVLSDDTFDRSRFDKIVMSVLGVKRHTAIVLIYSPINISGYIWMLACPSFNWKSRRLKACSQWSCFFFLLLKGTQSHEIYGFWLFHESVYTQPQSIPLGPFWIFSKILGDIRRSRCSTGTTTPAANLPLVSTTSAANFATSFASVVVTGGNLSQVSTILAAKPVPTTPVAMTQVANNGNNIRLLRP